MDKLVVELCLGSSCFARGNSQTLQALEAYLKEEGLSNQDELAGHLCLGNCSKGPNLRIDNETYSGLDTASVLELVKRELYNREWKA